MLEYDCITVPIEIEDSSLSISTGCREDSAAPEGAALTGGLYGRFAAAAILAVATSTASFGGLFQSAVPTTTFPTKAIAGQTSAKHGRRISLVEACKIADQMQDRIDAAYRQQLESEAQLTAVWEQGE